MIKTYTIHVQKQKIFTLKQIWAQNNGLAIVHKIRKKKILNTMKIRECCFEKYFHTKISNFYHTITVHA